MYISPYIIHLNLILVALVVGLKIQIIEGTGLITLGYFSAFGVFLLDEKLNFNIFIIHRVSHNDLNLIE